MKYDLIVVGAGIAGLTSAIYAKRAGLSVLVLEGKVPGGQIINTLSIENWPGDFGVSGADLMQKIQKQALELGAEIEMEEVLKISGDESSGFTVTTEDDEYEAKAVILAVGAENKKLGLAREEELTGRGVSYCATCDGAFYKDKKVAVIGGGNTALDDALYLSELASKVYLVHRREEFRGDASLVEKVRAKENIELVLGFIPSEILGEDKVNCLKLELKDSEGVRAGDKYRFLEVDGIFVAIGQKPATEFLKDFVDLDENGYIVAGEDCATSRAGVFAVGDCRTKAVRQLVTAAGDGAASVSRLLSMNVL